MRLVFTTLFSLLLFGFVTAQINDESPFPADFVIDSPASIAGVYDYGTQAGDVDNPIWGPQVSQTLSGEIVWAHSAVDSLGCEPITTDLTGKFAFVRRGICGFVDKVVAAQTAGAIAVVITNHYDDVDETSATVVGMLGGDGILSASVSIPAVFVGRATGELLSAQLDAGETVTVSFKVKSFYDPVSSFSYQTPLVQAQEVNAFGIQFANTDTEATITAMASATITAPSGATANLTGSRTFLPMTDSIILMDQTYLPTELGEHTVEWTNDQSSEVVTSTFLMTENTFATNSDDISINLGPSETQFLEANFIYQVGSLVLPNETGATVTYASFGISNAAAVYTGDAESDLITVLLYDADPDANGESNLVGATNFDGLTPVAFAEYTIKGTEGTDELLYVELEDLDDQDNLTALTANGMYYLVIAYDGVSAGTGIAPRFLGSQGIAYLNFPTTPLLLDQMYNGGWAGANVALQLHLDGFAPIVGTDDIVALDATKVSVAPNPVQNELNLKFALNEVADKVNIGIVDVSGKVVSSYEFEQVYQNNVQIEVSELPSGVYFIGIITPEGYRSVKIVKM